MNKTRFDILKDFQRAADKQLLEFALSILLLTALFFFIASLIQEAA